MITGSIVALVTPMHADGGIDWAALERLLGHGARRAWRRSVSEETTDTPPT